MSFKSVLALCASALLVQSISGQCIGAYDAPWGAGWGAAPWGAWGGCADGWGAYGDGWGAYGDGWGAWGAAPWAAGSLAASNGPGLAIASASPLIPAGVSVLSENEYAGELAVGGALPFLGTVAIEGALATAGAGAVAYGCGNGAVGITAEDGYAGYGYDGAFAGPYGYGAGLAGPYGYGAGLAGPYGYGAGCGCGCGAFY